MKSKTTGSRNVLHAAAEMGCVQNLATITAALVKHGLLSAYIDSTCKVPRVLHSVQYYHYKLISVCIIGWYDTSTLRSQSSRERLRQVPVGQRSECERCKQGNITFLQPVLFTKPQRQRVLSV